MNLQEYEEKLRELTSEELQKFNADFGGGKKTVEQRVREFAHNQEHEHLICLLLGLKTEAEKLTDAVINSADAAMRSATSARLSMIWSGVACLAAFIAAGVAIIDLFVKR